MTNQFSANAHHLKYNHAVYIATMRLALENYQVIRTITGKSGASIELNRPYEGIEPTITQRADKTFAEIEQYGCRLFWRIDEL
jgi:hypothetical protein